MNLEDIKSYKDACKIINRKPRRYRDSHINTYEQLSTITAAVNYIETGTPWKHIVKSNNKFYEIYYYKTFSTHSMDSDKGLFFLNSGRGVGSSGAAVGSDLRFATARGAEYVKTTFEILLRQWFDPDSIKQQGTALAVLFMCLINKLKDMTLEQFQNLRIGDLVVTKSAGNQSSVNPVTNIDRKNSKLHIGKTGKWRSFLQFEVLTTDYVVKYIKRRLNSRSSPYFTIEVKSDTEVIFKIHRRINSINEKTNRTTKSQKANIA